MQSNEFENLMNLISEGKEAEAYELVNHISGNAQTIRFTQVIKILLNSHFLKKRSSKIQSLLNLKNSGFNPTTVIDVGAQLGTPDLYTAFPESNHLFIEPVIECIPTLQNIAKGLKEARVINCAVSDFDGFTNLSLTDSKQYSSIEVIIGDESREIPVFKLDTIVKKFQNSEEVLLKVDVDGAEIGIFKGADEILKHDNTVIITEASIADVNPRFSRIIDHLLKYDYEVYDIIEPLYKSNWQLWQVDLILLKKGSSYWGSRKYE